MLLKLERNNKIKRTKESAMTENLTALTAKGMLVYEKEKRKKMGKKLFFYFRVNPFKGF